MNGTGDNEASLAEVAGTLDDSPYGGSGAGSLVALLKGLYERLGIEAALVPKGIATVSAISTVQTLNELLAASSQLGGTVPTGATLVYMQADGGDIVFCDDGQSPGSTFGMKILDGAAWPYKGAISSLKIFAASSTRVNLAFYSDP